MAYQRFLTDNDYSAIITQEHFDMLLRDVHDRVPQAEQSAEMDLREYLDQYYEIEKELNKGKAIKDYCPFISYPPGVFFSFNNKIVRSIAPINGYKRPLDKVYWVIVEDYTAIPDLDVVPPFRQLATYSPGDVIKHHHEYWRCVNPCGWDFKNVVTPGVDAWKEVSIVEWEPMVDYEQFAVVSFESKFYMLLDKTEHYDTLVNPKDAEWWGEIGVYTDEDAQNYEFNFAPDSHDYAVYNGKVYAPVFNPNADSIEMNINVVPDDPRNINVIKHMTRIALYYLHQTISPTNISETRRLMYEDSMAWLMAASKLKLNPQIARKRDHETGKPKDDWATATFQRDYDPYDNMWII